MVHVSVQVVSSYVTPWLSNTCLISVISFVITYTVSRAHKELPVEISIGLFNDVNRLRYSNKDRLCGLVVRVFGYRSGGLGSIPETPPQKSSGSGTGSTQPREYN
jgi:hypothetical protein